MIIEALEADSSCPGIDDTDMHGLFVLNASDGGWHVENTQLSNTADYFEMILWMDLLSTAILVFEQLLSSSRIRLCS